MAQEELVNSIRSLAKALGKREISSLRRISNISIDRAAVEDGEDHFLVSLIAYMVSKLLTKTHYWDIQEQKKFVEAMEKTLEGAIQAAQAEKQNAYKLQMRKVLDDISKLELRDKRYVSDLETKARTKLASRLYAQGFSLSRAATITGAEKSDLINFTGRTLMADRVGKTKTMEERLKHVRKLFA